MFRLVADIPTGGTESKVEAIQSSTGEPCVLMKGLVLLERGCGIEKRISPNENNSGIEEEEIKYKKKKLLEVKSKTPSIVTPCPFALNKYSLDWQNHGPTISSLSITLLVLSKHWAACGFVSSTPSIVAYTFQANETKKGESNEPLNQYCRGLPRLSIIGLILIF